LPFDRFLKSGMHWEISDICIQSRNSRWPTQRDSLRSKLRDSDGIWWLIPGIPPFRKSGRALSTLSDRASLVRSSGIHRVRGKSLDHEPMKDQRQWAKTENLTMGEGRPHFRRLPESNYVLEQVDRLCKKYLFLRHLSIYGLRKLWMSFRNIENSLSLKFWIDGAK
jgi:hypothetical protein